MTTEKQHTGKSTIEQLREIHEKLSAETQNMTFEQFKIPETKEEVAMFAGTSKSYISKFEKNLNNIRFSKLQRIINDGLGGHFELSGKF